MVAMLSLVFAAVVRAPPLGDSFIAFFATGYVGFLFWRATAETTAQALLANKPLLRFPNVNPFDAILARVILQALTNIAVAFIVLGGAFLLTEEPVRIDQPRIAAAFGAATLLGAGAGTPAQVEARTQQYRAQVETIPHHEVVMVPGTRHFVMLDAPEAFLQHVDRFLEQVQ